MCIRERGKVAGNNTKMNISYAIKAVDQFSKVHKKLTRQLSQIEHQLSKLEGIHTIKVDAETIMAQNQLERVEEKVEDIPRIRTIHIVVKGYKDVMNNFNKVRNTFSDISRDMDKIGQRTLLGVAFTALAPTVEVLAGGLGALASAALPAALGVAGLAAVGIPALTSLTDKYSDLKDAREKLAGAKTEKEVAKAQEELAAAQDNMSKSQLKAAESMDKFGKFFGEFSKKFEDPMLDIFNKTLGTTQKLLTIIEPAIQGAATAVSSLIDSFNKNLEAEDMKRFFTWVGETAGPNIEKLMQAVGNFVGGFANMMLAFDPLAQSFMDGFLNMSESFREWTADLENNQAFQDFMSTVTENAPIVLSFFGNLTQMLWNVIEAMSPYAAKVMELANAGMKWFNANIQTNETLQKVVGIVMTAIGVFGALVAPIMLVFSVMKTLLAPVITFIGNILKTKLVQTIKGQVFKIISQLGLRLLGLATGPFGFIISVIISLAIVLISNWDAIWAKTKEIFGNIASWVKTKINQVKATGALIAAFVSAAVGKFTEFQSKVREKMAEVVSKVKEGWNKAQSWLEGIDLSDIGANMIKGLIGGITSMAGGLVKAAKGVVGDAIQSAKNLLNINSPSKVFFEFGEFVDKGFINGMLSMTRKVQGASEKMAGAAVPKFNGGKGGFAAPPIPGMEGELRANSAETNRLLAQLAQQKTPVVIEVHGDSEWIRTYVNEQNAVDAIVRRF